MPDVYDLSRQLREALLKRDTATLARLIRLYGAELRQLAPAIAKLMREIDLARRAGRVVDAIWLISSPVWLAIERSILQSVGELHNQVARITQSRARAELRASASDAAKLIDAAGLDTEKINPLIGPRLRALEAHLIEGGAVRSALLKDLDQVVVDEVASQLRQGLARTAPVEEIGESIRNVIGGDLTRAMRIARTETLRAHRAGLLESFRANADQVVGWVWVARLDVRTCPICWVQHGTMHALGENFSTHPNCRCVPVPMLSKTKPLTRGVTAFEKLSAKKQREILGPEKYAAWTAGRFKLDELVQWRTDPVWGSVPRERSLQELTRPQL